MNRSIFWMNLNLDQIVVQFCLPIRMNHVTNIQFIQEKQMISIQLIGVCKKISCMDTNLYHMNKFKD